jgi:rubredoxin
MVSSHSGKEPLMDKWQCLLCGYVYDPEVGDPDQDIPPGTPFEDLPEDWTCPDCGATKEDFERVEE